ncbi:glycerophosphodiester phosphodiesterase [Paenibacillus sp. FJAT-26967]|uniref:glycerophosphodiester phosphodiesterase n=1 Tax=Paenibacillus sp. FJAT-26967 TaxID=1729690 RepID=UPI000838FB08|nr:glycerophosphodiester phosphodiesterase [Paenibacillus sp. FJAT-26967]
MSQAKQPLNIAHRGASGEAPENTLAAFKLGLEQGCGAYELDVHLSKDGQIVVIHDATIDRTTNGTGAVNEMTVEELKAFDAGSWFSETYTGERLPLLEEVFAMTPEDIIINIEIKGSYNKQLEPILVELLRKTNRVDTVVISSFDWKSLQLIKELEPQIKVGLLYNLRLQHHEKLAEAAGTDIFSLHPNGAKLDPEDIQHAQAANLEVYVWTVNTEEQMALALKSGADGIITDYPGRLQALIAGN